MDLQSEIAALLERQDFPERAVVTAGMPYANGPIHLGHLAGAHIPADIYARWLGLAIGRDKVLFVCGSDDHGTNAELAAREAKVTVAQLIDSIHAGQRASLERYGISLDIYSGTSRQELAPFHQKFCQDFLRRLRAGGMLATKSTRQWYDTEVELFLPDRYVRGTCPACAESGAASEECDACQATYAPEELLNPKSSLSGQTPELRESVHWHLDMWKVVDQINRWVSGKQKTWNKNIVREILGQITPSLIFAKSFEDDYKKTKANLPSHKSRYAPKKQIIAAFGSVEELRIAQEQLHQANIPARVCDDWAHKAISRDISWGVPLPAEDDEQMNSKTLYCWPESLIAPISFSRLALKNRPERWEDFWCTPKARVYQFIGQDNLFFYVVMQAAMWIGRGGDLQMTEIFSNFHLQVDGKKMSKSRGNFYSADELLDKGYSADQVRHFLALLSLSEKNSNFDFATFEQRNRFLAGPLSAALEKPISACHSKFGGKVPPGELVGKTSEQTQKIVSQYLRLMPKGQYSKLLFLLENYARIINGLFAQFKPHDDRHDLKQRQDALYSSFFILKNLLVMYHPFVPDTMERLRQSLNLPADIYRLKELGRPLPAGHQIGKQEKYF